MNAITTNKAQEELESALLLIINNVREYRDREQRKLSEPNITISDLMRTVGTVSALKNVESVLAMVSDLYGVKV